MESIHVSDLSAIAERAKDLVDEAIDEIIDAIDTKILVGNIHVPPEKKVRKKRTRKVKVGEFPPPKGETSLPDGDENSTFYGKKKREKKEPVEQ
mgnify:FL=1